MEDIGYLLLFMYSLGGGLVGLATAGVVAASGGLNILVCIILAWIANFIGSSALFYFARSSKSEAASYLKKHRRKLALAHILMKRHGSKVLFIQKFIYGVKTIVPLTVGITKYDAKKFFVINFAAALVWAILIGTGAYIFGGALLNAVKAANSAAWVAPMAFVIIMGIIYLYLNKITKKENRV